MSRLPMFQGINIPQGLAAQIKNNMMQLTTMQKIELVNWFLVNDSNFLAWYMNAINTQSGYLALRLMGIPIINVLAVHQNIAFKGIVTT